MGDKIPVYSENSSISNISRLGMYYFFCDEIHDDDIDTSPYGEVILKVSAIQILFISTEIVKHEKVWILHSLMQKTLKIFHPHQM